MSARVLVVDDSATVRRVVSAVLTEAGFSAAGAGDGAEALERVQRERFDLVLVDFVMPRLNGFQFAQAVRSMASLRDLPLVLMSARAEAIAERFMAATGSTAWLAKPFAPSELLAVVRAALLAAEPGAPEPASEVSRSAVQPVPLVSRRASGLAKPPADPAEVVARALQPVLHAAGVSLGVESLRAALAAQLGGRVAPELASALEELGGPRPALEGRLEQVGLGEVFQLLALQGQSGVLRIDRGGGPARRVCVGVRKGRVDGCTGAAFDDDLRLGAFLVAQGVDREVVERAAAAPRGAGELLGERLQREGAVSDAQLARALERQSCELIYECLGWAEGRFRFEAGASLVAAQRARLGLAADAVVMEGMRRIDEWRVMRALIPNDAVVLARADAEAEVDDDGRAVLSEVDGVRDVRHLREALGMSRFDLCQVLCRLLRARVLAVAA
jgi:CheY-like chemotaxis protein